MQVVLARFEVLEDFFGLGYQEGISGPGSDAEIRHES